ncbi:MAG: addiction module toxin, HicA family [Methylococcaceae bacterium]|nr:MAG: addiction module toxin, HicA family [Methylococcaceae bacterium]
MTFFPSMTGKDLLLALKKAGFSLVRVKGSHHFVQHADGRSTVVPVHTGVSLFGTKAPPIFGVMAPLKSAGSGARTTVVHTECDGATRIISFRHASRKEREAYDVWLENECNEA